jgi:hypothetical protein
MDFKLTEKKRTTSLVTFHILNARNDVVGSVNVAPSEANDLLAHWKGPASTAGAAKPAGTAAMAAAFKKLPKLSKEAILRGS